MNLQRLVPFALVMVASCVSTADDSPPCTDGKCDADQSCSDPRYGDGTCDMQLDCAVPDVDCFHTFDTDAEAAAWFTSVEQVWAQQENRAPRAVMPESDPRFVKARDMLDRGWAAFRTHRPVGVKLQDKRPALVLLDSTEVNAFVMPDTAQMKSAFSVQVLTGFMAQDADEAALLGVMMHELQHAVGLHLIGNRRETIRKFYVAGDYEPIGRDQSDDVRASMPGVAWRAAADQVSYLSNAELGGFAFAGQLGQLFKTVIGLGVMNDANACTNTNALVDSLTNDLRASIDLLDRSSSLDFSTIPSRVDAVITAARDECLAGAPTYVEVIAALTGQTADQVSAGLTPHDLALVQGKHVIDGIAALAADRRDVMRMAESGFESATGAAWTALRYFSVEEDADDTSVAVLRGAGLDPAGEAKFLPFIYPPEVRDRCAAEIAAGGVPAYGIDYSDEHHATCWRIYHIQQMAALDRSARVAAPPAGAPIRIEVPAPIRLPDRIADHVMY